MQPVAPPEAERQTGIAGPGEETPQAGRHGAESCSHPQQSIVVRVSGKQLVAPIAAECHRAVLAHQAAEQVGRNHGRIDHRLIELPGQCAQQIHLDLSGIELDVLRPEMPRDHPGVLGLVVLSVSGEAYGEGLHIRFGAHRHGRHETRIDTAAEQHTDRDVRHELTAHGILEQGLQSLHERCFVGGIRQAGGLRRLPIAPHPQLRGRQVEKQRVSGRQLVHALHDAKRAWDESHGQIAIERQRIDPAREPAIGHQRLELRRKAQLAAPSPRKTEAFRPRDHGRGTIGGAARR